MSQPSERQACASSGVPVKQCHDGALGTPSLFKSSKRSSKRRGVDDEGEVQLVRQRDLAREGSALVGAR